MEHLLESIIYVGLVPKYISRLPVDPTNTPVNNVLETSASYSYYYSVGNIVNAASNNYDLATRLESSGNATSCEKRGQSFCAMHTWSGWYWYDDPGVPGGTPTYSDGGKISPDH